MNKIRGRIILENGDDVAYAMFEIGEDRIVEEIIFVPILKAAFIKALGHLSGREESK